MRVTRPVATASVVALLLSNVAVSIAIRPAHSDPGDGSRLGVTLTLTQTGYSPVVHGETTGLMATVTASGRYDFAGGTVQLQRSVRQQPWSDVGAPVAKIAGWNVAFPRVRPSENTRYRVLFSGTTVDDVVLASSVSSPITVKVARSITSPRSGFTLRGKVSPQFARKKLVVTVSRTRTGPYRAYAKVRTTASGRYSLKLPRRTGVRFWKVVVPADARYVRNAYVWRTTVR